MKKFLFAAAVCLPLLTACGANAPKITPAMVFTDAANALTVLQKDVTLVPGLKPEVVAAVVDDAAKGLAVLAALSAETPAVEGAAAIKQAEGYLNAALAALPAVLPPPYDLYVAAAAAIVPTLEQYVASVTGAQVAGVSVAVAKRANGMSPAKASVVLEAAAH